MLLNELYILNRFKNIVGKNYHMSEEMIKDLICLIGICIEDYEGDKR